MNQIVAQFFEKWLLHFGLKSSLVPYASYVLLIVAIILAALLADFVTKRIIVAFITAYVKKSKNTWDDIFLEKKVFTRLSHMAPAIVVYYTIHLCFAKYPSSIGLVQAVAKIYMIGIGLWFMDAFINVLHDIYNRLSISKERTIKGYIQVVKIIINSLGAIFIIAVLVNKSPLTILAGLGALAAVLLLIFKDTIVGLASSIQLSANEMVKPGDWIELPKYSIDGTVLEISLTTVKVQNWDKTISTVPTFALVNDSFLNWKGMQQSDGRRAKRQYYIDMSRVQFIKGELLEGLAKLPTIEGFIVPSTWDDKLKGMTNLELFRKYMEAYLRSHPDVNQEMSMVCRHLVPSERGLPFELVYFIKHKDGYNYENVQSSITEHVIAILPTFGLKMFQNPTGDDVRGT